MKTWPLPARLALIGLLLLAWPLFNPAAALFEPARTGYDPLSPAERELALQLAQKDPALSGLRRAEILLVERHQEAKPITRSGRWPRRADVYVYDYEADKLVQATLNLETRQVDRLETAQHVQLPLTGPETGQAVHLALADPQVAAGLQSEFQSLTGQSLTNPEQQLQIHALIFRADARPGPGLDRAARCGLHRCAQLLLSTQTDLLINISPIVDLSQGKVVSANHFVGP